MQFARFRPEAGGFKARVTGERTLQKFRDSRDVGE